MSALLTAASATFSYQGASVTLSCSSPEELKAALGKGFSSAYLKLKHQEWNAYASHFTEWERQTTLDI